MAQQRAKLQRSTMAHMCGVKRQAPRDNKKGTPRGKRCLIERCRDQSQAWPAPYLNVIRSLVKAVEPKLNMRSLYSFVEVRLS